MKVRIYGNTAIVTGIAAVKDVLNGNVRDVRWRFTHVWAKRDDRWQEVSQHDSMIAERNPQIEAEASKVIDAFNVAGNKRDLEGLRNAMNFPYVRVASGKVTIHQTRDEMTTDAPPGTAAEGWDHSTVDSVEFIHSDANKVHAAVVFSRYKADGTRYATYRTLRIITKQEGHWGIQCSSSFAP